MGKAIHQTQREIHKRPRKPALQNMRQMKRISIGPFRNRDFSYQLFGMPPDCIAALVPRNFGGENDVAGSIGSCRPPNSFASTRPIPEMAIAERPGFFRCCHKFISGRQIEVIDATTQDGSFHIACPTTGCSSNVEDWVYPNEIAQPPDKWRRRVIRVVDSDRERFMVCGKSYAYSRRRLSQRFVFNSGTAA